jgi:hypothetical protein
MSATPIYLTWLNHLGGFEYFLFTADKEFQIDVKETGESKNNIFPSWPSSWGQNADTIDRRTYTKAKNKIIVRSQHLTANQRDAIKAIRYSPVVQIVESRTDRRTVLVDPESVKIYDDTIGENLYTSVFTISYTDDIATQKV